ncbi:hypothetical protein D3C81_1350990 [compost metagenome]
MTTTRQQTVPSKAANIRRELRQACESVYNSTSVAQYDAAKLRVKYLQSLLERYDPSAKRDPLAW